jgi:hypothetical protein
MTGYARATVNRVAGENLEEADSGDISVVLGPLQHLEAPSQKTVPIILANFEYEKEGGTSCRLLLMETSGFAEELLRQMQRRPIVAPQVRLGCGMGTTTVQFGEKHSIFTELLRQDAAAFRPE